MRVLSSAASSHDPTFLKSVVIRSSSDVSDTRLWLCAVRLQIDFYFYFPLPCFPFFKGIVLLSIQPGLGWPYNWSGHYGHFLSLPGVKLQFFGFQAHWLVTILTKQSWLLFAGEWINIKRPKFSIQKTPFGTCCYSDD